MSVYFSFCVQYTFSPDKQLRVTAKYLGCKIKSSIKMLSTSWKFIGHIIYSTINNCFFIGCTL